MTDKTNRLTTGFGKPVDDDQNSRHRRPARPGPHAGRAPAREARALRPRAHPRARRARQGRRRVRLLRGDRGRHEVHARRASSARSARRPTSSSASRTVGGEKGSADTERDPRGFAVKFYTEEGNYDMTGNNTPVFFIRDPLKFADFIHTQKRNPRTNLKNPDMFWDFLSLTPESVHQVTILFSDRGTPDGYRHMNGYSQPQLRVVQRGRRAVLRAVPLQDRAGHPGTSPATRPTRSRSSDPDYATRDLFEAIERGDYPSWRLEMQIMPRGRGGGATATTSSTSPRSGRTPTTRR